MSDALWCEPDRAKWVGVRPGLYGTKVNQRNQYGNSTGTSYTVPAGKTLLLEDIFICISHYSAAIQYIEFVNTAPANILVPLLIPAGAADGIYQLNHNFSRPLEMGAGWLINVFTTGANNVINISINGTLVDNALMGD